MCDRRCVVCGPIDDMQFVVGPLRHCAQASPLDALSTRSLVADQPVLGLSDPAGQRWGTAAAAPLGTSSEVPSGWSQRLVAAGSVKPALPADLAVGSGVRRGLASSTHATTTFSPSRSARSLGRALAPCGRLRTLTACAASWCSGLGQSRPIQTGVHHVVVLVHRNAAFQRVARA
jgi:hypothetical protein